MTKNTEMGRQPLQRLTVEQKKCANSWGVAPCTAGPLTNLIPNSSDLSDSNFWDSARYTYSDGISDPFGTNLAQRITVTAGTDPLGVITNDAIPGGSSKDIWVYAAAKPRSVVTNDIHSIAVQVYTSGGAGTIRRTQEIDITNGTLSGPVGSFDEFLDMSVTDLGSGWYLFQGRVPASEYDGVYLLNFLFDGDFSVGGAEVDVYYAQVAYEEDQDYARTTGAPLAPLGAGSDTPCYNTRSTCQDSANFDGSETLPLKFIDSRSPQLRDDYYLPYLNSVSISPARINVSGVGRSTSPFGKRAVLSATLSDHPHNDKLVDPYRNQRDYDPLERATFWTKWRARNQYYLKTPVKFESGYFANGSMVDEITREFVLTKFSGPDANGIVKIEAKDILSLAEDEKAQAPAQSSGLLDTAITEAQSMPFSVNLTPAGTGDEDYGTSGYVRINRELFTYTRTASSDTLNLQTRGERGTEVSDHDIGDSVQECLEYVSQNLSDILYDLLLNYANIPVSFLDKTQWDTEVASFQTRLYSTLITQPTGVKKLVSEMVEQMFFNVYYDERDSLVKIRVSRTPQGEEITNLSDFGQLVEDSVIWSDLPDQLITQAWVYYGQSDPTDKLDEERNYATVEKGVSVTRGEDFYNTDKIRKIFSRWLPASATASAADLVNNLINRFGNIPRQVTFRLDAKDRDLWLADFARMTNRNRVDAAGAVDPATLQINQVSESELGSTYSYVANEYVPVEDDDPSNINFPIAADLLNVNLRTLYESQFGTPTGTETIIFEIRNGVTIGGDSANYTLENIDALTRSDTNDTYDAGNSSLSGLTIGTLPMLQRDGITTPRDTAKDATYPSSSNTADYLIKEYPLSVALETGDWSDVPTVVLKLVVQSGGAILGEGGNGSAHGFKEDNPLVGLVKESLKGGDGGHAIKADYPIEITNNGVIACGGGGGALVYTATTATNFGATGGGGSGRVNSKARDIININTSYTNLTFAAGGSDFAAGVGASNGTFNFGLTPSVVGGTGGVNADGEQGTYTFIVPAPVGEGGSAGDAVVSGSSNITWVTKGDIRGDEN